VARELTLLLHFIGFGLLMTAAVAGFILDRHYHKATDLVSKAAILKASKPIGLLGPTGVVIQLLSGIGNMHALGFNLFETQWLLIKVIVFAVAATTGITFGIMAKKRGMLVGQMAAGKAPADAAATLQGYDGKLGIFHLVMPVFLIVIICLSIYGRLGGQ
jgi:hypothetical protein